VGLLARYRSVLAIPGARGALLASTVGRISAGMAGLAIILLVRAEGGSYGVGGACAAAFSIGFAVLSPVRARRADRDGQTGVLRFSAFGFPAGLFAALAIPVLGLPLPLIAIGAAVGGALFPPFGPSMRTIWAGLPDASARASAFALEAVMVEVSFVLGPLAVAVCQAVGGPRLALGVAGAVGGLGALLLAANPLSRSWMPHEQREQHPLGPLRSRRVRRLLLAICFIGVGFGAVDVGVPALSEQHDHLGAAGLVLALWSFGSMLGGLAYGAANPRRSIDRQYQLLVVLVSLVSAAPLLAVGVRSLGLLLLLYGMTIAPFFVVNSQQLAEHAPPGTTTEAYAWLSTGIFGGAALGNAVAGALVSATGHPKAAFVITAACGVIALAASWRPLRVDAPEAV
jgi:MFS family permease